MLDSLCIVQDSDDDKAEEISQMRHIFKDSCITILAAGASNADEGFLFRTPEDFNDYVELPYFCPDGSKSNMLLRPWSAETSYDPLLDPVNTRAWIFQERLLSNRLLIYPPSPHPLQWQCRSNQLANGGALCNLKDAGLEGLNKSPTDKKQSKPDPDCWTSWTNLVRNYSDRAMSDPRDKLPAIAGVADEFSFLWGGSTEYHAGIWSKELLRGLLWKVFKPKPLAHPPVYRAPSWSWASSSGQVIHPFTNTIPDPYLFKILSCITVPRNPLFAFGEVTAASLKVEGVIKQAHWNVRQGLLVDPTICNAEKARIGFGFTDDQDLQPSQQTVRCLLIVDPITTVASPYQMLGIILARNQDDTHRRVGAFGLSSREWFRDGQREVLDII